MKDRYFSHDANARSDGKIIKVRLRYGMEGYGIYFALLEMMSSENDYALPYTDEQFAAIAYDLHTDVDIGEFVGYCVNVGLFETDGNVFWSASFRRRMGEMQEKVQERSQRASNAALARWAKKGEEGKGEAKKPPEVPPKPFDAVGEINDPEWMRFVDEFHKQIGSLPIGNQLEELSCFFDEMGADVMIEALKVVNRAEPKKPVSLLLTILRGWFDDGVKTVSDAKAKINDHERMKRQNRVTQELKAHDDPLSGTPFTE